MLSKFTHSFIKKLLDTNIPIITNYFKSDISIVVDDVKGDFNYNIFLKLKWKILLSVFVNDFFQKEKAIKFRRKIYKFNTFDISPHSMTENEFLYYNFSKGENLSRKNFIKLWKIVKKYFNENSIKMGNIITSHFHLMSKCCVPILLRNNLKYYLCDIEPGKKFIDYNKKFLPYGDPSLATGNSDKKKLFQFYSGNPSQSSKMSHSFYDFLEGNISKEKLLQKIKKNLELLIYSGFPIYLRTHEYNLIKHKHNLKEILIFIDKYIKKENLGIKKVKLSTISENLNKRHSAYIKKINITQNKLNIFCKKNKNSINIFYKKKIVDYINYKKIKNNYEII